VETTLLSIIRTVAAPPSIVVKVRGGGGGGGPSCGRVWCCSCRVVCCVGVVLFVSCRVLFLLCVCVCDLRLAVRGVPKGALRRTLPSRLPYGVA